MPHNNPYTTAADAYGATAAATDQRALEGKILLKAARKLEELAESLKNEEIVSQEQIGEALNYNQKLWQLFVEDMRDPNHSLPQEIKNNVASLALFIFKRTHEILIETKPEKFRALIDINRNIAAGLMKRPSGQPLPASQDQKDSAEHMTTDSMA